jgi:hypothetical protein
MRVRVQRTGAAGHGPLLNTLYVIVLTGSRNRQSALFPWPYPARNREFLKSTEPRAHQSFVLSHVAATRSQLGGLNSDMPEISELVMVFGTGYSSAVEGGWFFVKLKGEKFSLNGEELLRKTCLLNYFCDVII